MKFFKLTDAYGSEVWTSAERIQFFCPDVNDQCLVWVEGLNSNPVHLSCTCEDLAQRLAELDVEPPPAPTQKGPRILPSSVHEIRLRGITVESDPAP